MKKNLILVLILLSLTMNNVFAKTEDYVEKTINFLKDSKVFFLATTTGNQAKVRPFGAVIEYNGDIVFCTGSKKDVYKQLKNNSRMEIAAVSNDRWIRITGKLTENTTQDTRDAIFKKYPELKKAYKNEKELRTFKLSKNAKILINNMDGTNEVLN
ncbi:MAG: pyridoxamine 5'-phosphate oxidase family protein [Rickettsiales bacterium]|nr:MAG: pyridoxamine 5'-phosphate oxidase family protein [Rickettsiales bacterium]